MKFIFQFVFVISAMGFFSSTVLAKKKEVAQPRIAFASPQDGDKVHPPFRVVMKAEGIKVRAAGEAVDEKTSGHHHVLVDQAPMPEGQVVPADEKHIHFGKAQTETELNLSPGPHTLTLQFADGAHRSYGPQLSQTIKIEVLPAEKSGKK